MVKMTFSGWILALCLVALEEGRCGVQAVGESRSERNCSAVPPYLPPTAVNSTVRLQELRTDMKQNDISAYIIPGTDAHLSEYTAPRDARMSWMCGFTGSSGTAVVTQDRAVLWTDSRYWIQAERQMDCNWELERDVSISSITSWLIREVKDGEKVGFDPFLFSVNTFAAYNTKLAPSKLIFESIPDNLVDKIWSERPPLPPDNLTRLPDSFIERTWQMKVAEIRAQMMNSPYRPSAVLLSALDETAWLFNMRGNDIPFNPFFYSYTLLTLDKIWLFMHIERLSDELKAYLNSSCNAADCVQLFQYDTVQTHLMSYLTQSGVKVWVGTEYTNQALYELITPEEKLIESSYSPVLIAKAVKDKTEQSILRDAHVRDAVAVMQLLYQLEKTVPEGKETELTAAEYVDDCRSKQKYSRGPSFATISASGPNAALAHYSPTAQNTRKLNKDEMYLIDSGGQYLTSKGTIEVLMSKLPSPATAPRTLIELPAASSRMGQVQSDGTTDITRTVHWGTPTNLQKEAYTRVLMGNIDISRTIFPSGTKGVNIEILGRRALWDLGLNYGHGTGHGIGNYFSVHEWPVGFGSNNIPFQEGMFTSIEPGYYRENEFGIRIEDIAVTVPADTAHGKYGTYLTFSTVSLVPYDRKLIDASIMSLDQLQWLDKLYETIRGKMGPELKKQGLTEVYDWMMKNTEPFLTDGSSAVVSSFSLLLLLLPTTLL